LTQIETENDHDQLTPIFNQHKKNLLQFGYKESNIKFWEKAQKQFFVETHHDFYKNASRNNYMGFILNNLGLGNGINTKIAE
jgi:hypothetical protein